MATRPGKPLLAPVASGSSSFLTEVQSQAPVREHAPIREAPALKDAAKASLKDAKAKSMKVTKAFIEKHCNIGVREEWTKVDDSKIAKLRGILNALQEENQSTQLLKKESENKAAKQELDATRSSVQLRLTAVQEKEELFKSRERDLQAHVQENEKSLRELMTKIEKDAKKTKDELAECKRLDREIESLQAELGEHESVKEDELRKIVQFSRYKKFLEQVVQECDAEFEGDIEVLINRHNTLQSGNTELFQANAALTNQLDKVRDECNRVQTKLQNEHLRISSQLHECQVNLDRQRAVNQEREAQLNRALEEKELKESKVGVIQMAIEQLFSRTLASEKLNQAKKNPRLVAADSKFQPILGDKNDVKLDEMLRKIVERMEDLKEILRDAHDADKRLDNAGQAPVLEEVEVKVQFMAQSPRGAGSHHEPGDSSHHTSQLTSGSTLLTHVSKDFAPRGEEAHADGLFAE